MNESNEFDSSVEEDNDLLSSNVEMEIRSATRLLSRIVVSILIVGNLTLFGSLIFDIIRR